MQLRFAVLPDGHAVDANRSRWRGPLDAAETAWCRGNGIALAYDPAQIGWVPTRSEAAAKDAIAPGRIGFRRWRDSDLPVYRALLDDPDVWRFLPDSYPAPLSETAARDLIVVSALTDHHDVRAVERDGEPVGQIRLAFAPGMADRSEGEISYWLGRRWWGRGIATETIRRFSALAFAERPDLRSIVARVHRDNTGSVRAVARAGFAEAGPASDDPAIRLFRRARIRSRV